MKFYKEDDSDLIIYSKNHGEVMLKDWDGEKWVFRRHPDGQWVSMRRATMGDLFAFKRAKMRYDNEE